ncbi:MAG TPA: 16S rRNA pseudouridine(516) synthase [Burkholderiaceae bacterium]|nr:16S rRNA pseudouridine(516) synthase [Burkholderiaceae bacterium]
MQLARLLFTQGFGTRRECEALVRAGEVRVGGQVVDDPGAGFDADALQFEVHGQRWTYREKALVMLHKPVGYECSQKPSAWPSVLGLLPSPLRGRGVQPVGRLDQDTTGLLLLTDDGGLLHRLTSPKRHVPKVYLARTAGPVTPEQVEGLLQGVVLHDDPRPVHAAAAARMDEDAIELTLTEGRYHQVKRMIAAVGNRVVALHRSRFGGLCLPPDLTPGQWCWVEHPDTIFSPSR